MSLKHAVEQAVEVSITEANTGGPLNVDARAQPSLVEMSARDRVGEFMTKEQWENEETNEERIEALVEREVQKQLN